MPKPPIPQEWQAILAKANPAVIATLDRNGSPVSVATWYMWETGRVFVSMDENRARLRNVRRDPRVSLTALDRDDWGAHISIMGQVVALEDDVSLRDIDRLSIRYTGESYPVRDRRRVTAWVEVERWHGWGVEDMVTAGDGGGPK